MSDIAALLARVDVETRAKLDGAFQQLYPELRVIAHARLHRHAGGQGPDTGALVHECWMRLQRAGALSFEHQGQFLALASTAMRSIIVDLIRRAQAERRGGDVVHVTLGTTCADAVPDDAPQEVLALDEALHQLAGLDERAARVVEMRYFAGFDDARIAAALAVSERTVRRDWERARAFLALALQR